MSYLINNQQDLNEIIFAKRNKSYGAYSIRSEYGNTVVKSLFIMAFGIVSCMLLALYFSNRNNTPKEETLPFIQDSVYVVKVDTRIKENKPKTMEEPANTEPGKKTDGTSITIVDSTSVETSSVEVDNTTVTSSTGTTSNVQTTPGSGTGTAATTPSVAGGGGDIAEPFGVDTPPEFEGGLKALYQFVSKNLKYPAIAMREEKSGTVYVKFVVDENGKVGRLILQNNVGYGLDEEALRVVGIIPNFKKPATVNGKPVKVYYQLPIKFKYSY